MDLSIVTTTSEYENDSWLRSRHGVEAAVPGTLDVSKLVAGTHYDANGFVFSGIPLSYNEADGLYEPFASASNEVQSITISGAPTGGTFTLTFNGETTAAIAYNASAAAVQAALEALGLIDPGDVAVTGSGPYAVTFKGKYAGVNVTQITGTASFTGGTSPAIATATTTAGGTAPGSDAVLDGFLLAPQKLQNQFTTLISTALEVPILKHGLISVKNLPVPSGINQATQTTGEFVFVDIPFV